MRYSRWGSRFHSMIMLRRVYINQIASTSVNGISGWMRIHWMIMLGGGCVCINQRRRPQDSIHCQHDYASFHLGIAFFMSLRLICCCWPFLSIINEISEWIRIFSQKSCHLRRRHLSESVLLTCPNCVVLNDWDIRMGLRFHCMIMLATVCI